MRLPFQRLTIGTAATVLLTFIATAPPAAQMQGDAEIVAWLIVLNENEVNAAMVGEQKASTADRPKISDPVLDYAKMLHVQHAKGAQDTKELATRTGLKPAETPAVEELRAKGKQLQAKLTPLEGTAFERTFVTEMANGHREALQKIEGFLKIAQNAALKQHLSSTRERVATHLKEAERLQASRS